ncbi:MAG: tryptophan 7-halogenase [Rhodobacteraceae bacterium]|nr:tryptophan 7-halogenase [Paracoccaceae bacterium]
MQELAEGSEMQNVLVLGGGTAGFVSALTLKKRLPPGIKVQVLYSSRIGTIGVGEGSLRQLPGFLHGYLGIDPDRFFREVEPTWKLGIRFKWGAGAGFDYSFTPQVCVTHPHSDLIRPLGFYCFDGMTNHSVASVLMDNDYAFLKDDSGKPVMEGNFGYHMDNHKLATFLEKYALEQQIELIDDEVRAVEAGECGIQTLTLASGRKVTADLFVDCSGFRSLLLGDTLQEPFVSYRSSLFCDRAVIGGWARTDEPLHPYTTSETMDCGWCWQIEHENRINRGYVYSSDFISDDAAEAEFRIANPEIESTNLVRFRSGRFERAWTRNVVAIGNSAGFVEPLEATAIAAICSAARLLAETLAQVGSCHVGASNRDVFNRYNARSWDTIADFLAVHYRFNTRLNNEFWSTCVNEVDLRGAAPIVEYYRDNGPCNRWQLLLEDPVCRFRLDGYYTLLLGQKVPHAQIDVPAQRERDAFARLQEATCQYGARGVSVREALRLIGRGDWRWKPEHFGTNAGL